MSNYPGAIDEFRATQNLPGVLYNELDQTTVYAEDTNSHSEAIVAIQTTLGLEPASAYPTVADRLDAIDSSFIELFNLMYPVGTIYANGTDDRNPNVYFGVGTWEPYAEGEVLAGKSDAGTFGTAGASIGAETVTLSTAQIPAHNHTGNTDWVGDHEHGMPNWYNTRGAANRAALAGGSSISNAAVPTYGGGAHYHTFTSNNTGGGESHNNIQPTKIIYYWIRTAL